MKCGNSLPPCLYSPSDPPSPFVNKSHVPQQLQRLRLVVNNVKISVEIDLHFVCTAIVPQLSDNETIIITIIIHISYFTAVQLVLKTVPVNRPNTSYSLFCQNLPLTLRQVLIITAVCIRIYSAGWILSSFKISCNLFVIISAVGSTSGTIWAIFSFHIVINFLSCLYTSGTSG